MRLTTIRGNGFTVRAKRFLIVLPLLAVCLAVLNQTVFVHAASPVSNQPTIPVNKVWYFPEGSVGGGFQQYFALFNPSATQTSNVTITYLLQTNPQTIKTVNHSVGPISRVTVNVNGDLNMSSGGSHVSVASFIQVTSGPGIVAERPLFYNHGGLDTMGNTKPSTKFYFSEASSLKSGSANYNTFLNIMNPSTTATATLTITYYTGSCGQTGQQACKTESKSISPESRIVAQPNDVGLTQKLAIGITSNISIVAERAMYYSDNIPNAGGSVSGASSEIGAKSPSKAWYFAEGYTGHDYQEYFELANFGANVATVNVKLEYSTGDTQTVVVTMQPYSLNQFDVNNANANPGPCVPSPCSITNDVAATITSDNPIVADRLMYFHYTDNGSTIASTDDTLGLQGSAHKTFTFAEGNTNGSNVEYLTLLNPTAATENVSITLYASGHVINKQMMVAATSRATLTINTIVNPVAPGDVSMIVKALGKGTVIVAERVIFFIYGGNDPGADAVVGYTAQ